MTDLPLFYKQINKSYCLNIQDWTECPSKASPFDTRLGKTKKSDYFFFLNQSDADSEINVISSRPLLLLNSG